MSSRQQCDRDCRRVGDDACEFLHYLIGRNEIYPSPRESLDFQISSCVRTKKGPDLNICNNDQNFSWEKKGFSRDYFRETIFEGKTVENYYPV